MTEDEMVGWHHQLSGPESEQALGDGEGHESLACCSPWGCKESDMTEQLNYCIETWSSLNGMWQAGWEGSLGENGSILLSPFTVHLKLTTSLIGYTQIQK